jgi:hypothetical protein
MEALRSNSMLIEGLTQKQLCAAAGYVMNISYKIDNTQTPWVYHLGRNSEKGFIKTDFRKGRIELSDEVDIAVVEAIRVIIKQPTILTH